MSGSIFCADQSYSVITNDEFVMMMMNNLTFPPRAPYYWPPLQRLSVIYMSYQKSSIPLKCIVSSLSIKSSQSLYWGQPGKVIQELDNVDCAGSNLTGIQLISALRSRVSAHVLFLWKSSQRCSASICEANCSQID